MKTPDTFTATGKLVCAAKNYAKHAAEMKSTLPTEPVVFFKPRTALIGDGEAVVLPAMSNEVHHEVELVALIGRQARRVSEEDALDCVSAYAVGLDMTARDHQAEAKKFAHPWAIAKGFDTFAPLGEFVSKDAVGDVQALDIKLLINGEVRQDGFTGDMVFSVAQLISYCSHVFTLEPGDCLYTGTPDGVGPVHEGDLLEATCTGLPSLTVTVTAQ